MEKLTSADPVHTIQQYLSKVTTEYREALQGRVDLMRECKPIPLGMHEKVARLAGLVTGLEWSLRVIEGKDYNIGSVEWKY
jgi:hypothetical protein